ncbi:MAG: flavodoxin family protein [Clostridia bacterium]|nr:flavodoxin family protein [Clostridia bacterium]
MKVLLLNGSPHETGCTHTALEECGRQLRKRGIETETFDLGRKTVAACIDCKKCWGIGKCVFDDPVNEVIGKIVACDGVIVGAPVYFGGIPGNLKCLLDRVFYDAKRLFSHKLAAAVVTCRRGGAETAFDSLNKYFMISSMNVVGSQYWNSVHGDHPEEVAEDLEGMQTMRLLADNMAYWLCCAEAGRAAGIEPFEREPRVKTSFYKPAK